MSAGSTLVLAMIRECIQQGRYSFTSHALTKHPVSEGFTARQAIEAIMNGEIVEHYPDQDRCLIAGTGSGLAVSKDYITTYIHCVCQYNAELQVVIITMYRPRQTEWLNQYRRRPRPTAR